MYPTGRDSRESSAALRPAPEGSLRRPVLAPAHHAPIAEIASRAAQSRICRILLRFFHREPMILAWSGQACAGNASRKGIRAFHITSDLRRRHITDPPSAFREQTVPGPIRFIESPASRARIYQRRALITGSFQGIHASRDALEDKHVLHEEERRPQSSSIPSGVR